MSQERRLLLVRHPETEANVDGRYVGRGDAPYTDLGTRQVLALVDCVVAWDPQALWASPLRRTLEVASAVSARTGVPLRIDERLTELDFGEAEGLTFEQSRERGLHFVFDAEDSPVAPGGESRRDIMNRSAQVIDEALAASERVAMVTHGGVFRSILVHVLGLPLAAIWSFHIQTAQIAGLRVVDGHGLLESFERVRVD